MTLEEGAYASSPEKRARYNVLRVGATFVLNVPPAPVVIVFTVVQCSASLEDWMAIGLPASRAPDAVR